jgi:hypothetical protein
MKVHICNYEIGLKSGILTKYADMLVNGLIREGYDVTVSNEPDKKADVNHHINYESFRDCGGVNTAMVTHIDTTAKLEKMKEVSKKAHGVCMSGETKDYLEKNGCKNLSVILPAANVTRRPRIVAIMTQLYEDGRKREGMFTEMLKTVSPEDFAWNIVGEGWEHVIEQSSKDGHRILYVPHYSAEVGAGVLNSADYLLYFGKDEGAISVLDAVYAGVRVIAPEVGFHKELGIDYPFDTQEELNGIFSRLSKNRAASWTWEIYVKEHIELWKNIVK